MKKARFWANMAVNTTPFGLTLRGTISWPSRQGEEVNDWLHFHSDGSRQSETVVSGA